MQSTPWLANRPPSVGGWHEMSSREFPVYSMVAEYHKAGRVNGSVMKHLRYHPAWPALSFLGSPNLRDGAEVLCDIVDPRWFLSPKKPNRWSRLFEFFGLNPVTMQFLVSEEKRGKCRHLDRAKTCIRCWTGEKKPPPGIRNLPPQLFLWAAFRSINQDKDSWKALRAASRKFLLFLTTSWLDEMHPSRELFVPEYFFQNRRQAKAFRKHRRENRPRLA